MEQAVKMILDGFFEISKIGSEDPDKGRAILYVIWDRLDESVKIEIQQMIESDARMKEWRRKWQK